MAFVPTLVIILGFLIAACDGQSAPVASNIYDSLQPLGCSQFLAILNKCRQAERLLYADGEIGWTVFAPNDTAFDLLPPAKRQELLSMSQAESEYFIMGFTLPEVLQTTSFREQQPRTSRSTRNTRIFFMQRQRREGNSASGQAGPTEYYANGAMVLRPNIPAGRSMIHVIDRVLDTPSQDYILAYIQANSDFYEKILQYVPAQHYGSTIQPLNSNPRVTVFVPTSDALNRIPIEKLDPLRNNPELVNQVVRNHIIHDRVMYTSFVYHNEGVKGLGEGQIIFRTSYAREAVFVNSGQVTAQITQGNNTCMNGVVHFTDTLLGYVYNSAMDEVALSPKAQTFELMIENARNELQQILRSASGITLFVPIDTALASVPSYNNLMTSQSLINKVIELCMLEQGYEKELTTVNGDYEARFSAPSQYYRRRVQIYSQGNETWIESGYVKARVVRPDVGVTNGFVHFIDAVPGVPTRDIPNTIFCEDWLIKSSLQLKVTGWNNFMRDTRLTSVAPCTTGGGVRSTTNVYNAFTFSDTGSQTSAENSMGVCGQSCVFTFFIPNGTAIDNFENMPYGRQIQEDPKRWRYVLGRHVTREQIYLEQTAVGVERDYKALNGDRVRYRRATDRYAYLYFRGMQARVLHSDLAGTNGVVHIIDRVIFLVDDAFRDNVDLDTSPSAKPEVSHLTVVLVLFCVCVWQWLAF